MSMTDPAETSPKSNPSEGELPERSERSASRQGPVAGQVPYADEKPEKAGFGVRVAAALVDAALILPVYLLLTRGFRYAVEAHAPGTRGLTRLDPVFLSIFLGNSLVLLYSVLEVTRAATPGKMLLRLRITQEEAAPATTAQLLARYALKHGARLCGLAEALTSIRRLRLFYAWAPLAIFRRQPMDFVTLRTIGELLGLFVLVGFFFTLGKSRQALYDRLTKTTVARRPAGVAKRGFEPLRVMPVLPTEQGSADATGVT